MAAQDIYNKLGYNNQGSLFEQRRNARRALRDIDDLSGYNQNDIDLVKDAIRADGQAAGIGSALAVMNGITGIIPSLQQLYSTGDTLQQQYQIDDINDIGFQNYGSFSDITNAYTKLSDVAPVDTSYDTLRGNTKGERWGNVLSATTTGATTGLTVGGPWGALAGGVIGLGAGLASNYSGDLAAKENRMKLQNNELIARRNALETLNASSEDLLNRRHRMMLGNIAKQGGEIKRSLTVKEFADKVLGNQKTRPVTHSSGLMIKKCKGGTMIRIKR